MNYKYAFFKYQGHSVIAITPSSDGQLAITKDVRKILKVIEKKEGVSAIGCIIVYRDVDGIWDAYIAKTSRFVLLLAHTRTEALNDYIHYHIK